MGKPPFAIVIARHGARLDAANKDWHLTTASPYDTPLSYGGWLQSRALGARILSQIRTLEDQLDSATQETHDPKLPAHAFPPRKPKRKIIIHSSPFLRCVQTSIAISSGISQNYNDTESTATTYNASATRLNGFAPGATESPIQDAVASPGSDDPHHRCLLRVDAFLGEWLSPDYYEHITPPPKSEKMVATAKTELLRRDESSVPAADLKYVPPGGHFPGGWSNLQSVRYNGDVAVHEAESTAISPGGSQRQRSRADSYDSLSTTDTARGLRVLRKINTTLPAIPDVGYQPPFPNYAISPSNPIPDGYVTHARDACVQVDYQWDSMRDPQDWGNGGEYTEEWSCMHTRFSTGLERMISWYENHATPLPEPRRRRLSQLHPIEDDDDMANTILVIVTHGAGCNALIGALSGEPALVNVATASFTLAVRKGSLKENNPPAEQLGRRSSSNESGGLANYRLVEIASTDHLRLGTPPTAAQSPTGNSMSSAMSSYRNRFSSRASFSTSPFRVGSSLKAELGLQQWPLKRPATVPQAPSGLWSSAESAVDTSEDDLVPNFGTPWSPTASLTATNGNGSIHRSTSDATWSKDLPLRTLSQRGLWGSAPLNKGPVSRRWTVTERP